MIVLSSFMFDMKMDGKFAEYSFFIFSVSWENIYQVRECFDIAGLHARDKHLVLIGGGE